jgi:hypothetical protein
MLGTEFHRLGTELHSVVFVGCDKLIIYFEACNNVD